MMADKTEFETQSYTSIFKATSLFGGVQVYQIIIQVIRSKFIAVLLGTQGVGIQGLLLSATQLVQNVTSLGLSQSAVRDVSEVGSTRDEQGISKTAAVINKLSFYTGIIGMMIMMAISPFLSKWTFGNNDYTFSFIILSSIIFFDQIAGGQKAIIQGLRRLRDLAKASAVGATIGLLLSVPLYYLFGIQGIVPTLVLHSLTSLLLIGFFYRRIRIVKHHIPVKESLKMGYSMMKMGVAMSISSILVTVCSYVLRAYIRSVGGVDEVGLFTAGFMLMSTYTGLVFTAMSTDYYPRLASVNQDDKQCGIVINQQAEIGLLILAPLLLICIVFMPLIVRILYSDSFLPANDYIVSSSIGMFFKIASWSISYVFIAKGESRLFVINEVISNSITLALNIWGYRIYGLLGLGVSFSLSYLIYLIQVYIIAKVKYHFSFSLGFIRLFFIQLFLFASCLVLVIESSSRHFVFYCLSILLIILSLVFSLKEINKRTGIVSILLNKLGH